jgi:hypothetical protein
MAKILKTTAKELAWEAYKQYCSLDELEMRERFENWWSDNYGNRDTIQFNPKYNVYIEGKKYIQAE